VPLRDARAHEELDVRREMRLRDADVRVRRRVHAGVHQGLQELLERRVWRQLATATATATPPRRRGPLGGRKVPLDKGDQPPDEIAKGGREPVDLVVDRGRGGRSGRAGNVFIKKKFSFFKLIELIVNHNNNDNRQLQQLAGRHCT
jgi:hypothetical protein